MSTPKIPDDLDGSIRSPGVKKFFNITKVVAGVGAALMFLYTALGPLWIFPRDLKNTGEQVIKTAEQVKINTSTLDDLTKAAEVHDAQIKENTKSIVELKGANSVTRNDIGNIQKSIDEINKKQDQIHNQYTDLNKNIIELNTSLKFFGDTIKELKAEVKENNQR